MSGNLRGMTIALLIAGSAAVLSAPPAGANRGGIPATTTTTTGPSYVPPPRYGQNPHPELPAEPNVYDNPVAAPTVVPVDLPAVPNPDAGLAGGGDSLGSAPSVSPAPDGSPSAGGGFLGGVLSRTGSETMPLVRAALAALVLGLGLVVLARRRRIDPASP
ncbi:MAG: hypothetical protein LC792_15690 [Actinobacteria bacterium]|nr:hypothetical protein [Actinomycetota bacterium]